MDFKPDKLDDILRRHKKACFVIRPDKHGVASGKAKATLNNLTGVLNSAGEIAVGYPKRMLRVWRGQPPR